MADYTKSAKAQWGDTEAYKEYEERSRHQSPEEQQAAGEDLMQIFVEFGKLTKEDPESLAVQQLVKTLQDFITEHFYTCTKEILSGLGKLYASGGEFTENIDCAAGPGTAAFASRAIEFYCK